ncbi:MAG TPA: class I SAM-dependent methyltransferase [Chitinispirillaceae bacterium]|nr:class I SAM-dependent methyltransferase [Chitinispirillaceae bacterium]
MENDTIAFRFDQVELSDINSRPEPFEFYTAAELWTNEYTSQKMLEYHLNESIDAASRNHNFINRSSKWIINKFDLNTRSKVIDFGCGPGLYTLRLAKSGAEVTGIDFSRRSLNYAQKEADSNNLKIKYINTNYLEYETDEKYDLIIMIMCDFAALSPLQRRILLSKFHTILKPNGAILLDVYSHCYFNSKQEQAIYGSNLLNSFWAKDDYFCFLNTFKYDNEKLILDKYTIYGKTDKRIVYNWFQCFNEQSIKKEFDETNLTITELYSNVSGDTYNSGSDEFAIIAHRK